MDVAPATVLIVDDELQNRRLLEVLLRPEGYRIVSAASGEDALSQITSQAPDLVLLDIMMPGMNGYEVARILKSSPATASIPIIMVATLIDREARLTGLNAGAEEFLTKPVDRAELWLKVRNLLRLKAAVDRLQQQGASLQQQVMSGSADLRRFRLALDTTADAIMLVNRTTMQFVELNATACSMTGYSRQHLLNLGPHQLEACETQALEAVYDGLIAGHCHGNELVECDLVRQDGSVMPVEIRRHVQRDAGDWIIVNVVRDVTERRNAEKQMAEMTSLRLTQAAMQASILDALPANIALLDPSGGIVSVNDPWRRFAESNALPGPSHGVGLNYLGACDQVHGGDSQQAELAAMQVRSALNGNGNGSTLEYPCHSPDEQRWYMLTAAPLVQGAREGAVVMHLNITQRKLAELALEDLTQRTSQRERLLSNMLSSITDFAYIFDLNGRFLFANKPLLDQWGMTLDQVINKNFAELNYPLDLAEKLQNQIHQVIQTGLKVTDEATFVSRDGQLGCFEYIFSPVVGAGATVDFVVGTTRDVTQRRQAQAEILTLNATLEQRVEDRTADLQHARSLADAANNAKSEFLSSISHEIRTPMNGVIGMVDVLIQSGLNSYQIDMVNLIRDSGLALLHIIDDILDFSKIEAERLVLETVPFSVANVAENVCSLLDQLAAKNNVEISLFVDPDIPDELLGDGLRLQQILLNLLGNAIKFSGGRELAGRVSLRVLQVAAPDDCVGVLFRVTDNGIGMNEETQARIFTAFTQADTSTTRRFGGTGLGLVISRRLVDLMGGSLHLQSAVSQGSTFSVKLQYPVAPSQSFPDKPPSEVRGLSCVVVGDPKGLAQNVAAYLAHGGALVQLVPNLTQIALLTERPQREPWVWVIDEAYTAKSLVDLRALAASINAKDVRFVSIRRGSRREPHAKYTDWVLMDGNVLTGRRLLRAVGIAAGRAFEEEQTSSCRRHTAVFKPPSREYAQLAGQLILVAEDNEINQKVILSSLALLGFTADVANNGQDALGRIREGDYALLLCDLHMPRMDGYQLAAAIRAQEKTGHRLPIVALTANARKNVAQMCLDAGMDDCLTKPASLADLQAVLKRWIPAIPPQRAALQPVSALMVDLPRLDLDVLRSLVGHDPKVIAELLRDFRTSAERSAADMVIAMRSSNPALAAATAHKLKSAARSIGALALGEVCAQIEVAGASASTSSLIPFHQQFIEELARLEICLDDSQRQHLN